MREITILGPSSEPMTELSWSGGALLSQQSNVWAAGQLVATYTGSGSTLALSYHLTNWMGSERVQTDPSGATAQTCLSLPYGDGETCLPGAIDHLFTGKERDPESGGLAGNDYFGARYFASSTGRFLSPDLSTLNFADLQNPQSLNLYVYARGNPLVQLDPNGLCSTNNASSGLSNGTTNNPDICKGNSALPHFAVTDPSQGQEEKAASAQQQNGSSKGPSFWGRMGQRFSNWWDGGGFHDNMHLKENITDTETYQLPATATSDLLGVGGALLHNTPMGVASTAISAVSDPSPPTLILNAESVLIPMAIPGADVPIAFGYAAWDGSKFVGNQVITPVFTPDGLQSDTINANGYTIPDPQAVFDSGGGFN